MLQIISGKFFLSKNRYEFEGYSPLYSNYCWMADINCSIATLSPIAEERSDYILKYKNQMEKRPNFALVRTGDKEIAKQFQNICVFGFQAIFDADKSNIQRLCGNQYIIKSYATPPKILPRYFEKYVDGSIQEVEAFKKLFDKIIGLPRNKYNVITRCLSAFTGSLNIVDYDFDLAYSMLVYCLETLSQNFNNYEPKWDDYTNHEKIDKLIIDIDPQKAKNLREIIYKEKDLKLQAKFVDFIVNNTSDSFFEKDGLSNLPPIRKSQFIVALKNAYQVRSSYAHELEPIIPHLKAGFINGDVYRHNYSPFFTYSGLIRLTRHVLYNFIQKQEIIKSENYHWESELPNTLMMRTAPSCWLNRTKGFKQSEGRRRLSGFLLEWSQAIISDTPLTISSNLMKLYESQVIDRSLKDKYKIPIIIHYALYRSITTKRFSQKYKGVSAFINDKKYLGINCIENMLYCAVTNQEWIWSGEECENEYIKYEAQKSIEWSKIKKQGIIVEPLDMPLLFEIMIMITMANKFFNEGYYGKYEEWVNKLILESSGNQVIHKFITNQYPAQKTIDIQMIPKLFKNKQS
jgi:hypothetical protein